jgi:hypothetical protein
VVVTPRRLPSENEAYEAVDRLLTAIEVKGDIFDALEGIRPLHPKHNTFPGEVFMRLAADALKVGGVSREHPISEEGLVDRYLPECEFRGRDNRKIRYALLAMAATHGGIEVDLLDEIAYWATDDFWSYAGFAAVASIRAVGDQRGLPLAELCQRLRGRAGVSNRDG